MKKTVLSVVIVIMMLTVGTAQSKYTISGYVKEQGSGELLPGVTIYVPSLKTGVSTNTYGFYSLTLPQGTYDFIYSFVGFETQNHTVDLNNDIVKNVEIASASITLDEIIIEGDAIEKESEKAQMSVISLPIENIANIPAFMGEKDVLKVIQLMPGVQSGSEGSSGIYVRGGGPDQNLIILDDATVYNASHLFGFFSTFNGDAIKSVELYKGGFPARFGGRLSSVIKMDMKDGNKEKIHGKVGVGILSSSLSLEGPLKKGKTSFLVSGRRTYFDALALPFMNQGVKGGYYFYDLNAKVNHEISDKDKLYISGYFGRDNFWAKEKDTDYTTKAKLGWGNYTGTARWNHQFNNKWFSNTSFIFSKYDFSIGLEEKFDDSSFKLSYISSIRDFGIKYDVDYFPSPNHNVRLGLASTSHKFEPSAFVVRGDGYEDTNTTSPFNSLESAVYIEDDMKLFNRVNINAGIRLTHFIHDKVNYFNPEPRLSMGYQLLPNLALKASYATMNQYIHLLTNSGIGLPTDLWVSSTDQVKPQTSQQVAFGIAKDLPNQKLTLTVEGYYKKSNNVIAYKEGASFLILEDLESAEEVSWEDNITAGESWSRGVEVLLQKKRGKFTGWLGYTLSKTEMQFDEINLGEKYLAKYDRTHDVSVVGIFKASDRITLSSTWVYGTGSNFTLPIGTYRAQAYSYGQSYSKEVNDYGAINSFRAEAYHRMDIGIQFHKQKRRSKRTWEIAFYNAYNRRNPFFYYTDSQYNDNTNQYTTVLKKVSIFPILPSFKYTLEF
ncbi:MAG: TonB-dependent receptor [Cyclobacteriaceae bacterium]|nr:TonB-dependent receptor [Cyclobacteriaceae bacterium]